MKEITLPSIGFLDTRYLKLDCSNDPLTQPLDIKVSNDNSAFRLETYDNEAESYSRFRLRKSDHISVLSETDNGDWLGIIQFEGCNTTPAFTAGARIYGRQNGASGAYVPADLYLDASTDAGAYTELKISAVSDNFVFSNIADETLTLTPGSITDSTGAISFGDENLSTTGTITGDGLVSTESIELADGGYLGSASTNNALSISAVGDATFVGQVLADNFSDGTLAIVNGNLTTTGSLASGYLVVEKDQDAMTEIRIDNDTEGTGNATQGFTMYDGATKVASIERTNNGAQTVFNNTGGLLQISTTTSGDILLSPAGVVYLNDNKRLAFGGSADTDSYIVWDNPNTELDIYSSGAISCTTTSFSISGDLTITGDDLFMATNTANYFLMADGTNYNPTSPANARTGLGLDAGGAGDIWVEKAGDTMTGSLIPDVDSSIDLGSSAPKYWANLYIDKIYLDSDSTIENTDVDAWNTHLTSDGSDHTFIDQAVTIASSPTFASVTTTGGRVVNTTRQTTTYTALVTDDAIFCDTDGGAWTLTLPVGVDGQRFMITNCGSSGYDLTIDANGSEEINGETTQLLSDGDSIIIIFESTEEWRIF